MSSSSIRVTGKSPSTPGSGSHRDIFFKKKLETITEYIDFLENESESTTNPQNEWQKNFYKNELKAALALNYSLIQIMGDNEHEIKELLVEISQLKKKQNSAYDIQNNPNIGNKDQSSLSEHKRVITPQRQKSKAKQAEKNILGAKYCLQKEQYKKIIEQKDELLSCSKEENSFLRDKLLVLGEKIGKLQAQNKVLNKTNKEIRKCSNKNVQSGMQSELPCERVLQFSPIVKRDESSQVIIEEISFNQLCTLQKDNQIHFLKGQIAQLKELLVKAEGRGASLKEGQCQQCSTLTENNKHLQQELKIIGNSLIEVRLREEQMIRIQQNFRDEWDEMKGNNPDT